jgi:hypothetical protein
MYRFMLVLLGLCLFAPCVARAAATTFMAPVPISPQAIAADPVLGGFQTWDIRVHIPPGESWGYTGTLTTLTQGQFYNSPLGGNVAQPQLWGLFPQLRYDTFITIAANPDVDSTFGPPDANPGAFPGLGDPPIFSDTTVSVVWGPGSVVTGPGTFTVARLTFSNDAVGSMIGFSASRPGNVQVDWSFPIPIPEPSSVGGIAVISMLVARRRTAVRGMTGALAIFILLVVTPRASAAIQTIAVQVPISPAAIAADPALANFQTWDLRVVVNPGEPLWGFSGMDAILTQGSYYSPVGGSTVPQPQLWGVAPNLRFDTFVTQAADPANDASFVAPNITSGFPDPPLPIIFTNTRISAVWHGAPGPGFGPGVLTVARLTFTHDALGTIVGHSVARATGEKTPFEFTIPIPEPAVGLLGALPWMCFARRPGRRME